MQRGVVVVPAGRRKVGVFCVLMAVGVCVVVHLSWALMSGHAAHRNTRVPSGRFWRRHTASRSFWNKEQRHLDITHNPLNRSPLSRDGDASHTGSLNPCEPDLRVRTQVWDYNTLPPHFQDFLLHMRCRKYPTLIDQPHACVDEPFLLLAIKSLVPHFDRRQAIRETWGHTGIRANRSVVTVFLLGNTMAPDHFPDLTAMLGHEAELHRDILQWDYRDSFFNLTLKDVLFLEWFSRRCPGARFVLKGDDDVFVNTPRIVRLLLSLSNKQAEDLFIGDVISNAVPHRDRQLKYFIPESVFMGQYPPYAGGGGYLFSGDLALRLHDVSQRVLLYPIDDVYTGMCLQQLGLVPQKHPGFRTFDIEEKRRSSPCTYRSLMLVHSRTPQEMLAVWPWIVDPELDCL